MVKVSFTTDIVVHTPIEGIRWIDSLYNPFVLCRHHLHHLELKYLFLSQDCKEL